MSQAKDSPTYRLNQILRGNFGVLERANGHIFLIDGTPGEENECGVIFLNPSWAFYDKRVVKHGYLKKEVEKALKTDGELSWSNHRDGWPSKYERIRFREGEE